ncbi:MAG TPA: hypothetical protein GXZ82_01945 [Firmicutes bacterium]|jgi:hypothetical protein|nr:hypothetical protein [Bacillota bacterium]
MGFFSKLFGKGGNMKKYEDIYLQGRYTFKQSTEYAFKQAVDTGVKDGFWSSAAEGAEALYQAVLSKTEQEDKADLEKAKNRIK